MSEPASKLFLSSIPLRPSRSAQAPAEALVELDVLEEAQFKRMLCLERKRTERSSSRFVLMLLELTGLLKNEESDATPVLNRILTALSQSTRETDIKGWYRSGEIAAVIFTEIGEADGKVVANALLARVTQALSATLSIEQINSIRVSFHVFPDPSGRNGPDGPNDPMYPDVTGSDHKRASRLVKRGMDVAGSLLGLVLLSPVLTCVALAIKFTSKGPVLFRQHRIGQFGRTFTFLKFRSMYVSNDPAIHKEYTRQFISGQAATFNGNGSHGVYKITNDPRVTPVGRFLRRTSLDELPQLLNVLLGHMSLVGPRPPVPYEFECYQVWHKRRLLAVRPGITGLWQVGGRSKVKFDEMVRLDLQYASAWSVWLDVKILLQTPRAVLAGIGAY
jgi:exopolysaccharide biosynthesis polyprenyl glycosylphosphotransferase